MAAATPEKRRGKKKKKKRKKKKKKKKKGRRSGKKKQARSRDWKTVSTRSKTSGRSERGWPETANTWEPFENIQSCADIIEAFEERSTFSLRYSKYQFFVGEGFSSFCLLGDFELFRCVDRSRSPRARRRKRKHGGPYGIAAHKKRSLQTEESKTAPNPTPLNQNDATGTAVAGADGDKSVELVGKKLVLEEEIGDLKKSTAEEVNLTTSLDRKTGDDQNLEVLNSAEQIGTNGHVSVNPPEAREEDGSMDGFSKVESTRASQGNVVTGAKRRKSGCVRRFQQGSAMDHQDEQQNTSMRRETGSCGKSEKSGNKNVNSELEDKNKLDDTGELPSITKLLKPVRFYASVTNNVQQVSITFKALR
ncbi:hypothetical protein GW17_00021754 [Ensete ventricosum]|nr:hypothetical protein GW17_00021754 [Ensete ventricosum]